MHRNFRSLSLMLVVLLLGACASGAKFSDTAPSLQPVSADTGRIFFYRPSSMGAAIQPKVHLNDEVVGEAIAQGYFFVDRPPGEYKVTTSTEVERSLSFVLEANQTRYVRLSMSMGFVAGHVTPKLIDAETALKELKNTKAIDAK
ncbi:MAG: DUF2846 domain-containing protein [Gammaproteobacteria bacterium]|nr:DUF2846 domain-containing protein [Gammaproteobacteria bacterium]